MNPISSKPGSTPATYPKTMLNLFKPNRLAYPYQKNEPISEFRYIFFILIRISIENVIRDRDRTPRSVSSEPCLHCLPIPRKTGRLFFFLLQANKF